VLDEEINCLPVRYFDLSKCLTIGQSRVGFETTFVARVAEVEDNVTLGGKTYAKYVLEDKTSSIQIFIPEPFLDGLNVFCRNDEVIVNGKVKEIKSMKCIINPLVREFIKGKYKYVAPAYSRVLNFEKDKLEKFGAFDKKFLNKGDLLAIHGFSTKQELLQSRINFKFQQLFETHLFCFKNSTALLDVLLTSFKSLQLNGVNELDLSIYQKEGFGDVVEVMKKYLEDKKKVQVISPLAYMTTNERDNFVFNLDNLLYVPRRNYVPRISIESDVNHDFNSLGTNKRYAYFAGVLPDRLLDKFSIKATLPSKDETDKDGLLIIEDADRFSTLQICEIAKRANCKTICISNSANKVNLERLGRLEAPITTQELLFFELGFRREGDHLGREENSFKNLSIVNLAYDKDVNAKAEEEAKRAIRR
jgi:hypothetical protein